MPAVPCFGIAGQFDSDPESWYNNKTQNWVDWPSTPCAYAFSVVTLLQHILQHEAIWKWWPGRILQIPSSGPCISRQRMNCPEGIISKYGLQVRATSSITLSPEISETGPQDLSMPTFMVFSDESLRYAPRTFILFSHDPHLIGCCCYYYIPKTA